MCCSCDGTEGRKEQKSAPMGPGTKLSVSKVHALFKYAKFDATQALACTLVGR